MYIYENSQRNKNTTLQMVQAQSACVCVCVCVCACVWACELRGRVCVCKGTVGTVVVWQVTMQVRIVCSRKVIASLQCS